MCMFAASFTSFACMFAAWLQLACLLKKVLLRRSLRQAPRIGLKLKLNPNGKLPTEDA